MRELLRPLTRRLLLVALFLPTLPTTTPAATASSTGDRSDSPRLVATVAGRDHDRFAVRHERIDIMDTADSAAVAGRRTWRIEGDIHQAADLILFAPDHEIVRRDPLASPAAGDTALDARFLLTSSQAVDIWGKEATRHAIAVPVWLHHGRVVATAPFPLPPDPDRWNTTGGVLAIPDGAAEGCAALLLWTPRGFARPAPTFGVPQAQAALAAMHLGPPEEVVAAIHKVPNPRTRTRAGSSSLLHLAAAQGHAPAIEALLDRDVPPGIEIDNARPVHIAARHGRARAVTMLATAGGRDGNEPARAALEAAQRGHLDIATSLLNEHQAWKRWTAATDALAEHAARHGLIDLLHLLADRDSRASLRRVSGRSLLARTHAGDTAGLAFLLENGADGRQDHEGTTALHAAARRGYSDTVKLLLGHRVRVDAADRQGRTPLMLAARNRHAAIVEVLLAAGARADPGDRSGLQALHYAVIGGDADAARLLIARGAAIDATDAGGATPLDLALRLRAADCVEVLAAAGAPFAVVDPSSLEGALALDRVDLLERAAARGWDPAVPWVEGWPQPLLARHFGAKAARAWMATRPGMPALAPPPSSANLESPPALLAPPVSEWFAGGWPQRSSPLTIRLLCVLDTAGAPRFALPEGTVPVDARLPLHANLQAWQGRPAMRGGQPIPLLVTVPCLLPATELRVFDIHEVDEAPQRIAGAALHTQNTQNQTVLLRYETRQVRSSRDPRTGQYLLETITIPVYGSQPSVSAIEDAVATLVVEPDGTVSNAGILARATGTPEPARVVLGWRFAPGLREGQPVRTRLVMRVSSDPSP